jgi:hypothetical protein
MRVVGSARHEGREGPTMHTLTMVLLTIALVCEVHDVRSSDPAEILVVGSLIVALVVHDLLRDRRLHQLE